jgi:hypothetical protein
MAKKPEQVTQEIVKILYDEGAPRWTIQQKGVLVAAIKLQLEKRQA